MTFATTFKQARQKAGLSAAEAAELLNVTRMTIHNWESGKREPPIQAPLTQAQILKTLGSVK